MATKLGGRAVPAYQAVRAPNFGLLTQTALVASRDVLMPAKADYLSTVGLDTLWAAIYQFRQDYAAQVKRFDGRHAGGAFDVGAYLVVFTMVEFMRKRPAPAHEHYMTMVQKQQRLSTFKSVIRQSVTVFGYKNAHVVPPVLQIKPADQIRGELVELTSEFLRHFDAPKGGRVAA